MCDNTMLIYVSDCSKTQKMYEEDLKMVKHVPDCF